MNVNWSDDCNKYKRSTAKDGRIIVTGYVTVADVQYVFKFRQEADVDAATGKRYISTMRGEIKIRSRRDGCFLQVTGGEKKRRILQFVNKKHNGTDVPHYESIAEIPSELLPRGSHPKILVIVKQTYVHSIKNKDIQAKIVEKIEEMCTEYLPAIEADLGITSADNLSLARTVRNYGEQFAALNTKHHNKHKVNVTIESIDSTPPPLAGASRKGVNANTLKRKLGNLNKIAGVLGSCDMGKISAVEITQLYSKYGEKQGATLARLGHAFYDYCRSMGYYHGKNPFDDFFILTPNKLQDAPQTLKERRRAPKEIPQEVEEKFRTFVTTDTCNDEKVISTILTHDGFSASAISKLTTADVIFDGIQVGSVAGVQYRDDLVGATHNYTRPLSPFAAQEIQKRKHLIMESKKTTPLLQAICGKKLTPKKITAHSKKVLENCGIDKTLLTEDETCNVNGIGIELFKKNHKSWLQNDCGLARDNGAVNFLNLASVSGDVTADSYRSFCDYGGQRFLLAAMDRDKRHRSPPNCTTVAISQDANITNITVPPDDLLRFTACEIEIELTLEQWIEIFGTVQIRGIVECEVL